MNIEEQNYLNLLKNILEHGNDRIDRTGVGTKSIFGTSLRFSLENDVVPIITTRKIFVRGAIEELLFFVRGETNTKLLEAKGVNIWKGNTSREFLDKRGLHKLPEGDIGRMYGWQWRNFGNPPVDQLKNALELIKNDPTSRRIMVTAYDPSKSNECVLDPCHMFFQFYVNDNDLSLQFYLRSSDSLLGLPFNIFSYALLTKLFAAASGLNAKELIFIGGDVHLYKNHFEQAKELISREPYSFPTLKINKKIDSIDDMEKLQFDDFKLENYQFHPSIKAKMAI